jgi:predicted amidohydrolase
MSVFSILGLQLDLPNADNRQRIASEMRAALARFPYAQMVVLAELATYGFDLARAEENGGEAERFYQDLARELGAWIVPGSLYEKRDGLIYNMTPVVNPAGEIIARYRKIYPWMPYEVGVASGNEIVVFDVPDVGRFGVSICYDQWFPEIARAMAWQGAEVIIHPIATSTIDRQRELIISQANALMNQCYFVCINDVGQIGNGRSIVVGPEGEVLHQSGELQEYIPLTLDLEQVRRARRNGTLNMAQALKSFRDVPMHYPCYNSGEQRSAALDALGPLELRRR